MPFPDPFRMHREHSLGHGVTLHILAWLAVQEKRSRPRRGRRRDLDDGGVPVEPTRPRNLSGGAAAALEYEDDGES